MRRIPPVALALAIFGATAQAAPPASLIGKSVVVSWTESRQQRFVGEAQFRSVGVSHNLSIYISTAGRIFMRQTNTARGGSGTIESIGGETARRLPSFSGSTMTVATTPVSQEAHFARRVTANFDAGFGRCDARVVFAKEPGHATSIVLSKITKKRVEIAASSVGSTSCSIQSGNVLGG
jgi:hypothetical protein